MYGLFGQGFFTKTTINDLYMYYLTGCRSCQGFIFRDKNYNNCPLANLKLSLKDIFVTNSDYSQVWLKIAKSLSRMR